MNVKDIDIFEYIKNHTITQTRDHFGVGSYRINRILSEMDGSKRHKRKTTDEISKIRDYTNHGNLFNQVLLDISVIGRHLNLVNCTRNSHPERENDYSSDDENND